MDIQRKEKESIKALLSLRYAVIFKSKNINAAFSCSLIRSLVRKNSSCASVGEVFVRDLVKDPEARGGDGGKAAH